MKNKDTFCIMAHRGFYIDSRKIVKPCCVFGEFDDPLYYESGMSFDDVYNSDQFIELRRSLDNGKIPNPCLSCFNGSSSHRENMNRLFLDDGLTDLDYETFGETSNKIEYIDIRSSNYCNFKCRMCNPVYSTSWESEMRVLDSSFKGIAKSGEKDWFSLLENKIDDIKYFYMAGGEPLMMPEFEYLLDKINHRKDEIKMFLNTNLSILTVKNQNLIDIIKEFKFAYLFISCDGFGSIGEYQRTGFSTETFYKNLKKVQHELNGVETVEIQIVYAISAINIFDIFNFRRQLFEDFNIKDDSINFQFVSSPWYLSPVSFSNSFKETVYDFLMNNIEPDFGDNFTNQINEFIFFLKNNDNKIYENKKDIDFIKKVDLIRKTNIEDIAPWVVSDIWNRFLI